MGQSPTIQYPAPNSIDVAIVKKWKRPLDIVIDSSFMTLPIESNEID